MTNPSNVRCALSACAINTLFYSSFSREGHQSPIETDENASWKAETHQCQFIRRRRFQRPRKYLPHLSFA